MRLPPLSADRAAHARGYAAAGVRATPLLASFNCTTAASVHTTVTIDAAVFAPDGHTFVRTSATGPLQQPEEAGRRAGEQLLRDGAAALLHPLPHTP